MGVRLKGQGLKVLKDFFVTLRLEPCALRLVVRIDVDSSHPVDL